MLVKIVNLDSEDEIIAVFPVGNHILGRGDQLQCNDKRVSRRHAALDITENGVKLSSIHINPCFIKAADGTVVTILSKDNSIELHDGDKFALLADKYWFKVKIKAEDDVNENGLKRPAENNENEYLSDKRIKTELSDHGSTSSANNTSIEPVALESDAEIKEEMVVDNDVENEVASLNDTNEANKIDTAEIKQETSDPAASTSNSDQNKPTADNQTKNNDSTTQKTKSRRERCWYSSSCYRKNPNHRLDYSHPGDPDYASDPDDDRPVCGFGAACYRQNRDHRREFKHPPGKPAKKNKRKRKAANKNGAGAVDYGDLSDDEEDPFIDDGDSDEYVNDSHDSDSDYEDSQAVDEESEEIRTLVKEAKKFNKR